MSTLNAVLLCCDMQPGIVDLVLGADTANPERVSCIENVRRAVTKARDADVKVIFINVAVPGYTDQDSVHRNKLFSYLHKNDTLRVDSTEAQPLADFRPQGDEILITKHRMGPFSTTDVLRLIEESKATKVYLCGLSTSGVILSCVRTLADLDYEIVVLDDACGDKDDEVHRVLTQKIFPVQADVKKVADAFASS
ncbi:hypothetical protein SARC_04399 [Sphaeroforma arctica JP610]|uniref:Isochorismatase-like domain-containing protein n=1 Tax=Sphaeroforma arctica JP610 TaxID=667725 RepID=A0A0L0G2J0_9EUKA|nr:hypothetical protein SARC_04399 [Sphaeroforma arctica JP610]KNC83347.1 hypothetical protein SARC_04399 [Sphaeroforma arctica JP610]|eukprot:XP_014157249.1 hypothetical protein SARC_04399 [Sphaeroforma arctica JP610]